MTDDRLVFSSPSDGILLAPPHCGLLAVPGLVHQVQWACTTTTRRQLLIDVSQVRTLETGVLRTLLWARRYCSARGITLAVAPSSNGVLPLQRAILLRGLFPEPTAEAQDTRFGHRAMTRPLTAQAPRSWPPPAGSCSVELLAATPPL